MQSRVTPRTPIFSGVGVLLFCRSDRQYIQKSADQSFFCDENHSTTQDFIFIFWHKAESLEHQITIYITTQ